MFRKIVSNLPFSPALVGQLSFYARRLRKEELTRRLGLIFTVLALVVQSLAVFSPPESANAASSRDFVRGGVSSLSEYLKYYDKNSNNLRDMYNYTGITRAEIAAAKYTTINSHDGWLSYGRTSPFSAAQGNVAHVYKKTGGGTGVMYSKPLRLWDGSSYAKRYGVTYKVWLGYSKKMGSFAIMRDCGNLATKKLPTPPKPAPKPTPKPVAACTKAEALVVDRTLVQLSGAATASGGAAIKSYSFTVQDSSGSAVYTKSVATSEKAISLDNFTLSTPGAYTLSLAVGTTVGTKTDSKNCVQAFSIAKPAVCSFNPDLPANSPDCQPCPGNPMIWIKDEQCRAEIIETKAATNITQSNRDATSSVANSSDRISYTLSVENQGFDSTSMTIKEQLDDVLEYANLVDSGGGTFDPDTKTLSWPSTTVAPKEKQSRTFVVQVKATIPTAPTGQSDRNSYDCQMTNTYGNTVNVSIDCPAPKYVEHVVKELPHTGPTENIIFGAGLLMVVTYFYARSRQLGKEVRLIRRHVTTGTF